MLKNILTDLASQILNQWYNKIDIGSLDYMTPLMPATAVSKSGDDSITVRIASYSPYAYAPVNWLSAVEARIRDSVNPNEASEQPSSEWIRSEVAYAAIAFFRSSADLLPTEPHIYGTGNGDLVAEFETPTISMTGILSDKETILFGVPPGNSNKPVHAVVRRGSNQLREEIRSFSIALNCGERGGLAAAR